MAATYNFTANAALTTNLEVMVEEQQWRDHKFARWMAPNYVKYTKGRDVGAKGQEAGTATGAPIEMEKAFIEEGRISMLIPVMNRFTDPPIFGNLSGLGLGEARKLGFRSVSINQTTKILSVPVGIEKQKVKMFKKLINDIRVGGTQWMSDWMASSIQMAAYAGLSPDLAFPVVGGGLGTAYVSHPNFYVPNSSGVATQVGIDSSTSTYTVGSRPGTTGYEAAVAAGFDGMNNAATYGCTAEFIADLVQAAATAKINPIMIDGAVQPFYPVWVKDTQYRQLQRDPDFKGLAKSLFIKDMAEHPLGNGAIMFYEGAAIFPDNMLWAGYTAAQTTGAAYPVTSGQVWYGPPPTAAQGAVGWKLNPTAGLIDPGAKAVGFLIGKSALTVGTGESVHIVEEIHEIGNTHEVGLQMIQSVVRNDVYDTTGTLSDNVSQAALSAGDFYENCSSLAFATYSPFSR